MWKSVIELVRRLFTINEELNRLQSASKKHGDEIRELYETLTRVQYEMQLQRERDIHEREKEKLLLENRLLLERLEQRGLPPPSSDKKPGGE